MRGHGFLAAGLASLAVGAPLAGGAVLAPATPTIASSTPNSPANNNTPTLNGAADAGSLVTLYTDSACTTPVAGGTATADGSGGFHIQVTVSDNTTTTFHATAADSTPSTSPCSDGFTYVEDSEAPATPSFDSHPSDPSTSRTATFTFSASGAASYSCQLDGGGFSACASGVGYSSLPDGPHTFQVRAADTAGNQSGTASFTWTIDATPPSTPTIISGPSGLVGSNSATFTFSASGAASYSCQLDGGAFSGCPSGSQNYSGLSDGLHTFGVKAVDSLGNESPVASRSWTIDTMAPAAPKINSVPPNPSGSSDATFTFSGDGDSNASFQCQLDGGAFSGCPSGSQSYTGLSDGSHMFGVKEVDQINHSSPVSTYTWTIDTVHPLVTLTDKPLLVTNQTTASFSFSTNEAGSKFECSLDTGVLGSCTSPKLYDNLGDGSHTFSVRATSPTGNTGIATTYTWTVDTVPPETRIVSGPPSPSSSPSANFTFTSSEAGSSFSCSLDSTGFAPCASPKTYLGLGDGKHVFRVQAIDAAGNSDASTSTYTWRIAGVGPPKVDHTPPGNVAHLKRKVGYGVLVLKWKKPSDSDFDHVGVYVSTSHKGPARALVYSGRSQSYTNKRFKNGFYYRYLVVAYDHAANGSRGAPAVVPPSILLRSPRNGRVVHSPPLLRWAAVRKASFYNVQIYFHGRKVLSAWPGKTRRALARRWAYSGHRFSLRKGTYLWYVWPGFGPRSKSHYGQLLGQGMFKVH